MTTNAVTVGAFVAEASARLVAAHASCADPSDHAYRLLEHVLRLDRAALVARPGERLDAEDRLRLDELLGRRCRGEPLEYLLGWAGFWDVRFSVGPGCLVPRPETELLVETLLVAEPRDEVRIAEFGAGSGCIGIAALRERSGWKWSGYERSAPAFKYLEENARRLLPPRNGYTAYHADFFSSAVGRGPYDWVVANPPYVTTSECEKVSSEVRHEPREALDGGADGLDPFRDLVRQVPRLLQPAGGFLCEIDPAQAASATAFATAHGLTDVKVLPDLAGRPRLVSARAAT